MWIKTILLLAIVLIISCSHNIEKKEDISKTTITKEQSNNYEDRFHKTKSNTNWQGTYKGFIPCADCSGIETFLTLNDNETYTLKYRYIGKSMEFTEKKGSFIWNDAEDRIILKDIKDAPNQYQLAENSLIQLDINGNRILGSLQDEYVFEKENSNPMNMYYEQLIDKTWQLIELNGITIPTPNKELKEKATDIKFEKNGNMSGFAGCNYFSGPFHVTTNDRIFFGQITKTLAFCTRQDIEDKFMTIFNTIDNYYVENNILILRKGISAPIAKFKLVK